MCSSVLARTVRFVSGGRLQRFGHEGRPLGGRGWGHRRGRIVPRLTASRGEEGAVLAPSPGCPAAERLGCSSSTQAAVATAAAADGKINAGGRGSKEEVFHQKRVQPNA